MAKFLRKTIHQESEKKRALINKFIVTSHAAFDEQLSETYFDQGWKEAHKAFENLLETLPTS